MNFYLPKKSTNNRDFIISISKVINNNIIQNKDIKRHDYITRSIILLIVKLKLNDTLK